MIKLLKNVENSRCQFVREYEDPTHYRTSIKTIVEIGGQDIAYFGGEGSRDEKAILVRLEAGIPVGIYHLTWNFAYGCAGLSYRLFPSGEIVEHVFVQGEDGHDLLDLAQDEYDRAGDDLFCECLYRLMRGILL